MYQHVRKRTRMPRGIRLRVRAQMCDLELGMLGRYLVAWIDTVEDTDNIVLPPNPGTAFLSPPSMARAAEHHHAGATPERRVSHDGFVHEHDDSSGIHEKKVDTGFFGSKEPVKGRKWDHKREGEPVIMMSGIPQQVSPWGTFIKSSMYGPLKAEDTRRVDDEFLRQQTPGYEKPWRGDLESSEDPDSTIAGLLHSKKKRRTIVARFQAHLLTHPLIPLAFRVTILITSVIAIGLASSIHHLSDNYSYAQNPSATMATVVDSIAIPYTLYITWDEYTGKPLGLRSPKAKIRLVLLDLFFIIFQSANLALAFEVLTERDGSCKIGSNGENGVICDRVKALCGILMIGLIAWSLTFNVSIFR
ncbi:hypothetical protein BJ878DRAFT_164224 [Calycina marina]|uniref:Regulator of phospholipase D SRF1 n=1 Tax=Calycina marina TaxID=1763456 RepID=A0A9P8CD09_9HELO|nr:hypothetical protein BJ878DRAFT_164224 [Calycina marina]